MYLRVVEIMIVTSIEKYQSSLETFVQHAANILRTSRVILKSNCMVAGLVMFLLTIKV